MLPYTPPALEPCQRRAAGKIAEHLAEQMRGAKPKKGLYTIRIPEGSYNLIALYLHHIENGTNEDPS